MEEFKNIDDFLAKWASGELSDDQKKSFEQSEEYTYYKAILEGTEVLDVPHYNKEGLYQKVQAQKEKEGKVISLVPKWVYTTAAAVAVLFFGYIWPTNSATEYSTGYGEQLTAHLPDNSEVIINSNSTLSFHKKDWKNGNRNVDLNGEAFFNVEKGSNFTVETTNGRVTVMGTEFTVSSEDNFFQVVCYEGKVRVSLKDLSQTLLQGDAFRIHKGTVENWKMNNVEPTWIQGESNFTNAPLSQVVKALENQFDITINTENVDTDIRFTGSFTHGDMKIALQIVFESMDITYTFTDKNTVILVVK
ncbi:FecR family protein [Flagellimonas pacifica]|uniref:FecR family protein n=1 Tax=Flagellimonas pacifica TaxID=1247520 RepID=A0A285MG34_9FLAO|nr:FecR domain-containing protein [Allomuricauda parva]SNY95437.1 FecR family protein [Allomuricauda parva]